MQSSFGFDDEFVFIFAYPIHWDKEGILNEFQDAVRNSFTTMAPKNLHFVSEAEAMLESLSRSKDVNKSRDNLTLVVDVGGGTTQFVAAKWTGAKLEQVKHHTGAIGGLRFDDDVARHVAKELEVPPEARTPLLYRIRILKKTLNQSETRTAKISWYGKEMQFDEKTFEEAVKQTINAFSCSVWEGMFKMDLRQSNVEQVMLVGGGAKFYLVRDILKEIFDNTPVVYEYEEKPEETIVRGAALWAISQS